MADLIESLNQAINLPIAEPVAEPAPAAPAAPATPDPLAEYLTGIAPELHSLVRPALEAARTKWEGESAPQRQTAEQMQAFAQAMGQNPRGMLAFLAQHYNVPFADPTTTPPAPAGPQPTAPSEVETIKRELLSIPRDAEDAAVRQVDALDRLMQARSREAAAARVGTVERMQLSLQEQSQREQLKRDYPDVDVDRLWPQITRVQSAVRDRPYLAPDEAMAIHLFKPLVGEVRRLRGQAQRPAVNEARAQVAGPTVGAPVAVSENVNDLSEAQIRALLAPFTKQ